METKKIIRRGLTPCSELQVRESGEGSTRTIEGYAIMFGVSSLPLWENAREVIEPEAVTRELLDSSDIKFTMFHDNQILLARSKRGKGSLSYEIDEKGVKFSFEAPDTVDGDKAVELVKRGIIDGCSFAFSTYYADPEWVSRETVEENGEKIMEYHVRKMLGIYDMTLTPDPAYPDTEAAVRELREALKEPELEPAPPEEGEPKTTPTSASRLRKLASQPLI